MTDKKPEPEKIIPRRKRWYISPIKSIFALDNKEAKLSVKKLSK